MIHSTDAWLALKKFVSLLAITPLLLFAASPANALVFDYETGVISGLNSKTVQQAVSGETLTAVSVSDVMDDWFAVTGNPAFSGAKSLTAAGTATGETSVTFSLAGGKTFDLTAITFGEWAAVGETVTLTSNKSTTATCSVTSGAGSTGPGTGSVCTLSGAGAIAMQGITSFTVTASPSPYFLGFDDITLANIVAPPGAPTITGITPSDGQLSVAFTAGTNGGSAITNYEYSTNNGSSFTALSPAATTSPIGITGLTNGTTYQVKIRAVNAVGSGTATASTPGTPATTPSAPTITSITPSNGQLSVAFTAGATGGSALTNYEYSTNGGGAFTAVSPAATASPIVIIGLTNGTTYQVQIRAVNAMGSGTATASTPGTPATTPSAPTITGITPGNMQLSVAFTAGATGGSALTNYEYSTNGGGLFTAVSPAATTAPLSSPA